MTDLDARGLLCPLPVLRLRKQLLAIPEGGIVRLIATDDMAMVDVPHFCGQAGHAMIGMRDLGDGVTEFTVRRGPRPDRQPIPPPKRVEHRR